MKNIVNSLSIKYLIPIAVILIFRCSEDKFNDQPLKIITSRISSITNVTAYSGGQISSEGGSSISEKGICWSEESVPTINDKKILDYTYDNPFTCFISGLKANSTYYVRAYIKNENGTSYGDELSFKTTNYETVTDLDSNVYSIIEIGDQVWLRENLSSTRLNDGTVIPVFDNVKNFLRQTTPGLCWYSYEERNKKTTYGALYNWHTVNTGKICPTGWHIPDTTDWKKLFNFLEGSNNICGALKEQDTIHWINPNASATNSSNFTALPGGRTKSYFEIYNGFLVGFENIGTAGYWWASDEYTESHGIYVGITDYFVSVGNDFKTLGLSIRCIKN
jgi:uncharacterized protein (TIGR02145 family)